MNEELAAVVGRARNDDLPVQQQHLAFAELVRLFEERAFGWALHLLDDPEEARDATQDAFVTAWLKLRSLREAEAFGGWLKRLVATQCNRRRRKRREVQDRNESNSIAIAESPIDPREHRRFLANAMGRLPEDQLRVIVLFYFLGRTLIEIATLLGIPRGTVGKRLHSARIAIRRRLPREIRDEFLSLRPSPQFLHKVREGMFDEYVGEYRFDERPEHVVRIWREGAELLGSGGGQRNVLASIREASLVATEFDGEGRFLRDRAGRIAGFAYYEFGVRLGVARRIRSGRRA